ncbi:Carboxymuconolactone decarboxylase [Methanosalsum zhilinae DSM 4017]|uniref:Carboxymuconolactone decarboxylase n=2 Tax=Methanosalsum zhilinae TaxID=39669 RepID=F7XL82_METZD|nr:carboxymuconolactone decarboxylase family protein [Methanosalsum zhilinae]AEH60739.1 Carboxymuconolactone decarboxylase [Methanosalsum zhilinae DSM 4017]
MPEDPLKIIRNNDPELFGQIENTANLSFADGDIPLKYKLLIAMSLDASKGAVDGVKALARRAMDEGATKEEMFEVLRIAYYITGAGSIYTAVNGLIDLFDNE